MPLVAQLAAVLGAACALPSCALRTEGTASRELRLYGFRDFVAEFNRTYKEGTEEWNMRKDLFDKTHQEIMDFNAVPGRGWMKGITQFMDYKEGERKRMLGYAGRGSRAANDNYEPPEEAASLGGGRYIPREFSVEREGSKLLSLVRDQGNCGSCWAEAATSTLEGQVEANATLMGQLELMHMKGRGVPEVPSLSSQTVVSCTPNERHCGGKGGCAGATVELAYDMVLAKGGLPFATEWPYESGVHGGTPECKTDLFARAQIAITGYTTLPVNRASPLKEALVETGGPIAVSVDATHWFQYTSGIFVDTDFGHGDFNVNHAVTLVAYQEPSMLKAGYWTIKNSWGEHWGEGGRIRLEMKRDEDKHCGWDWHTHEGLACDGDPNKAWVCGTCGILYDSTFPTGVHLKDV